MKQKIISSFLVLALFRENQTISIQHTKQNCHFYCYISYDFLFHSCSLVLIFCLLIVITVKRMSSPSINEAKYYFFFFVLAFFRENQTIAIQHTKQNCHLFGYIWYDFFVPLLLFFVTLVLYFLYFVYSLSLLLSEGVHQV